MDRDRSSEVVQVESRNVGRIIGSRGSNIRQMQETSQARIQVSRDDENGGQRSVEISGTREQIEKAKLLIDECQRDGDFSSRGSSGSGGFGGRGQRGGRRDDQWGGGGGGQRDSWRDRTDDDQWGRRSDRNDAWGGRSNGHRSYRDDRGDQDSNGDSWGGRRNEGRDRHGGSGRSKGYGNESDSWGGRRNEWRDRDSRGGRDDTSGPKEEIYILSFEVGKVIGQGGNKIRSLQDDSNCRIKVSRDGANGVNLVELFGSPEQTGRAKTLIAEVVDIVDRSGVNPANGSVQEEEEQPEPVKRRAPIDWSKVYQTGLERQQERFKDLPPIIKDFYDEHEDVTNLSREEVTLIRKENNNIIVESSDKDDEPFPNPVRTFEDAFHNFPLILEQIYRQNFVKPSPIQCQAWPVLLKGKDLIGIAQTGTGKTLAFLLPALVHIDNQPIPRQDRKGPSALIMAPTRELAQQIEVEVNKINYKGIRSICVYGGGDRREQLQRCKKGVEIVVATPGRLNDFVKNDIIDVTNVTYLVMDEADRMLDLGFELEIKKVMMDIRPDRQTVMTSATWPDEVQEMADSYMTDPYKVFVGTLDLAAVHSVRQCVEICQDYEKKDLLLEFIHEMGPTDKAIVFVGKKIIADDLSSDLAMSNIICQCIHGDREQCDREAALSEFKSGYVRILVATDVASRGLDVPDITHVINYDFPRHIEEYVHRIGRTGRAGRSGVAITFVTRGDWKSAQQLIEIMSEANQEIPDDLVSMAERYTSFKQRRDEEGFFPGMRGRGRGRGGRGGGRRRDDEETFFM